MNAKYKKEKQNNSKQLPLDVVKLKYIGLTVQEIQKLKVQLHKDGARIISFIIKPTEGKRL